MSPIAIILLGSFMFADFARIRRDKVEERAKFMKQVQIESHHDDEDTNKSVVDHKIEKAFKDGVASASDGTEVDSAGAPVKALEDPAAFVQEAASQSFFPARDPPNHFSKTRNYVKNSYDYSRIAILKAACDSSAFSCEEVTQFASGSAVLVASPRRWVTAAKLFAEGRNNTGCISDPTNAKSIVDSFKSHWGRFPYQQVFLEGLGRLEQAFIGNEGLKPAKSIRPPPVHLQTGLRTDKDMEKLLGDMEELQLIKDYSSQAAGRSYVPGSPSVEGFSSWLKRIRAHGEQFSGPQLVTLVDAMTKNSWPAEAISVLLQHLEQYVTGVTCEQAKQIFLQMVRVGDGVCFLAGLDALKSNIVDGYNKVDIVAFSDLLYPTQTHRIADSTEKVLKDVGLGLPPKNNAIWGVVKGNPVIFVMDESTSMDVNFTLGDDTFTRRSFCHSQLETVLKQLPDGTYFNVIQYSSSAVKIFQKPMLISKTNIDAAMQALSGTWRSDFTPGQDPAKMLQNVQAFALNFKQQLNRSTKKKVMEALQLAYATTDLPSQQPDDRQHTPREHEDHIVAKGFPQIYFLTSGQPDGGARQILDNIDEFDNGRHIPVNSIAFIQPVDPESKQFVKALANKTGGFFRSIEPASTKRQHLINILKRFLRLVLTPHNNKRKWEPTQS